MPRGLGGFAAAVLAAALVTELAGCCLSTGIQDRSDAGTTSGGTTTAAQCPTGDIRVNGTCVSVGNACGAETAWVGDTCVTQDCAHDGILPCQTADGGLGRCVSGGCYDVDSDPENCGSYEYVCPPASTCVRGLCLLGDGGLAGCTAPYVLVDDYFCVLPSCPAGSDNQRCTNAESFCCGGRCSSSDIDDCSACGFSCSAGATCENDGDIDICVPVVPSCADAGFGARCQLADGSLGFCCANGCTDVLSDPLNCANCAQLCPTGASCTTGQCSLECQNDRDCSSGTGCVIEQGWTICLRSACDDQPAEAYCAAGDGGLGYCCSGGCIPIDSTCGSCEVCGPGQFCASFGCTPYVDCATEQPSTIGQVQDWLCLTDAGAPGRCCGSGCVDFDAGCTAASRCSSSPQPFGGGGCLLGQNVYGACCGDACVDLEQDPSNCGQCGNVCASGVCVFYQRGDLLPCLPSGSGTDCLVSCPEWASCLQGLCVFTACPGGEVFPFTPCQAENGTIGFCCDVGVCAHPLDDPQNCGFCGNACAPGQACVNGSCTGFPGCGLGHMFWFCGDAGDENQICCPGSGCSNLLADSSNCGYCGNVCLSGHTCSDGGCVVATNLSP